MTQNFVPATAGRSMPMGAAGAVAMLGAAPAYADKIDDAAKKLSADSYDFLKKIDWNSDTYLLYNAIVQIPRLVLKAGLKGCSNGFC